MSLQRGTYRSIETTGYMSGAHNLGDKAILQSYNLSVSRDFDLLGYIISEPFFGYAIKTGMRWNDIAGYVVQRLPYVKGRIHSFRDTSSKNSLTWVIASIFVSVLFLRPTSRKRYKTPIHWTHSGAGEKQVEAFRGVQSVNKASFNENRHKSAWQLCGETHMTKNVHRLLLESLLI
jgi:hypothetical protein